MNIMKSKLRMRNKFFSVGMIVLLMLFIIACGSSDDAPPVTYNISGTVSGATLDGITINLTGAATTSTTTDASGNFSITGLANGTYTVTSIKAGYTFNPVSSVVVVSGASVANANFVATAAYAPTFSISGAVSGAVQAGVMITLSGTQAGTAITNASGNYSFSGLVDRTYVERHHTVIPSLTGYTFTPGYRIIVVSYGNSTGNNFTSVAVTPPANPISSVVNVSGENITGTNFGLVLTPSGTEDSTDSGDLTSSR